MTSQQRLANSVAIITGSSSGIGKAIAIEMAREGASVVINYHKSSEGADEALEQIKGFGGTGITVKADVSKEDDVKALFTQTIEAFGRLDILVNNTGRQMDAPFLEMTLEQWDGVISTNLTSQFLCSREAAHQFIKQAKDQKEEDLSIGKIICMSSVHDMIPWAGHVNYAASKGGVLMFMKSIAQELAPLKIRVNAISPGAIKTPINKEVWSDPEKLPGLLDLIPYKRIGKPEDVAKATIWLASDESDYVTGETLYIDGGMMLYPEFADNG
ncbi:SDR family oxidoreductase [Siphonobacter sp. SORGH_AS_0500]|uniref:SDR family oxidoreductase n=1 Tax=Siphonobacter sp. SORGH_AS_0500 TaxID=1864824 RepID=UPI00285EA547|nr:SDR family oxidoreductase [Siphonobacter sp. SORGH_AS_0500]MDR6192962.1 glucose 1-dehydrogenase [Siphonobacter sp. SORGH_AS_0500]